MTACREWKNAVLHTRMEIGDTVLMAADVPPVAFNPCGA